MASDPTALVPELDETLSPEAEEAALEASVAHLPIPLPEMPPLWARQPGETTFQWHAFQHFREQEPHSCFEAYKRHRKDCLHLSIDHLYEAPKHWRVWSSRLGWMERARAWDEELDRQVRDKLVKQQTEARERHARLAQAMLTVLSLPVKAALEAARNPQLVENLTASAATTAGASALVAQVARISAVVPGVVTMERLALGLSTDEVGVDDRRDDDGFSFADRIVNDPAATELAIQLLDKLAGSGPSTPVGLGPSSLTGEVADSPAPEPPHEEAG